MNHEVQKFWQDEDDSTPLSMAAKYGHEDVVKLLLGKGADPNKAGRRKWTPLHMAAANRYGPIGVSRILMDRGAMVNTADVDGETPLHSAARNGNFKVAC